jgi:hypothetical protein
MQIIGILLIIAVLIELALTPRINYLNTTRGYCYFLWYNQRLFKNKVRNWIKIY